jgi:hypothetical protein
LSERVEVIIPNSWPPFYGSLEFKKDSFLLMGMMNPISYQSYDMMKLLRALAYETSLNY